MDKSKNFFKSFLFYGIITVLSGIIVKLAFTDLIEHDFYNVIIQIIGDAFLTIGVGLIIGYVMDMTKNSDEYIQYIEKRLQNTIMSRKFISELSIEKRSEIIEQCLLCKSSHQLLSEYVTHKSKKLSEICQGHLRSNIDYLTTASKQNNKVILHTHMRYRITKVNNEYQDIIHIFAQPSSKLISLKIISANRKVYNIKSELLKTTKINKNQNETAYQNIVTIPEHLRGEPYLTIEADVEEHGYDHWAFLSWMSLYPTNGISYKIICNDNLIIKENMSFDDPNGLFSTNVETNSKGQITSYTITCEEWTDPYTGFALVISEP